MPRNISFALTTPQFLDQSKTVTRRIGWAFLKQGDILSAVEKAMGLKKGEKIKRLGLIQVVSTKWERLEEISDEDCIREGFPDMKAEDFIQFLISKSNKKIDRKTLVNRIEFVYLDSNGDPIDKPFITAACEKCNDDHYFPVGCCSGRECGCMGQPVALERCKDCNPAASLEPGEGIKGYAKHLGVIDG